MTAPSKCSRLARLALGLYPLAFRRRYGQEMLALLEQTPTRPLTVLDLIRGAVIAHARPRAAAAAFVDSGDRVRASASGVLACWVAFAVAGFGFYKTTENLTAAGYEHPLLGDAHFSVQALAMLGSAAVVLGALPLIVAALAGVRHEPGLRRLVSVPPLAVLIFAGLTAVLVVVAHSQRSQGPTTGDGIAFAAWGLAGLACGAACVVASRRALFAVPVAPGRLVAAFACGAVVTAAMAAMTLAVAVYAIALATDASHLAGARNGPLQAMSVVASLLVELIVMALAAVLATTATRRGWRAAASLRASGSGAGGGAG